MKQKIENILTITLVICALTTTALVMHRELTTSSASKQSAIPKPVLVSDWKSHVAKGVMLGPYAARVQLIEFADFECPFCADFHKEMKLLRAKYPTQVSLTYVYFPLPGHRFALVAARAAECANEQGRFEAMYDQLFDGRESFGVKPWGDYASAAGVPDLLAFNECIKKTDPISRVEEGKQLGAKLDVKATPTLIVNGWMLGRPPTAEELDAMVKSVLAGKSVLSVGRES